VVTLPPPDQWPDETAASRKIPPPQRLRNCGCRCLCRADADDRIEGNIKFGHRRFAFGKGEGHDSATASKIGKRAATKNLGMIPKHIDCLCTDSQGNVSKMG
jgi:hypothetical protein